MWTKTAYLSYALDPWIHKIRHNNIFLFLLNQSFDVFKALMLLVMMMFLEWKKSNARLKLFTDLVPKILHNYYYYKKILKASRAIRIFYLFIFYNNYTEQTNTVTPVHLLMYHVFYSTF